MALIDKFTKRSAEEYSKPIDYSGKLPSGAVIQSVTASARDTLNNATAAVVGAGGFDGATVLIPVEGGVDGRDYLITYTVTLDNGNVLSDQLLMRVRDSVAA